MSQPHEGTKKTRHGKTPCLVENKTMFDPSPRRGEEARLHHGLHAQDGVTLLGQEAHQGLGILSDGLVTDHIAEVVHTVQLLGSSVDTLSHLILQSLGHPDRLFYIRYGSRDQLP